jgi:MOB kinase activator 1
MPKRNSLVDFAQATLGNEGMRQAVKAPLDSKVSKNEWLALKTHHVYKDVLLILGAVRDGCCTEVVCKVMGSSPKFEYAWADEYDCPQPTRVTAPEYFKRLTSWVERQLRDEHIFPSRAGGKFPADFEQRVKNIFKRLFRVYAHVYWHHKG